MNTSPLTPATVGKVVKVPAIAWPTLLLFLTCVCVQASVIWALHKSMLSEYVAFAINTMVVFVVFTPMHDAAHGSIGSGSFRFINSIVGHLCGACFPIPFSAFRHLHLQHHRYTNEAEDPDLWAGQGPAILLPLRWFTVELNYYYMYLSKVFQRPLSEGLPAVINLLLNIIVVTYLANHGYFKEVVWGWVLPGRTSVGLLAYFFDYLPHYPHHTTRSSDIYKATSVTSLYGDKTWWLTWPLLHQNYHNIHHLAPFVPFYMYSTIWHSFKKDLVHRGTEITPIFGAKVEHYKQ